MVTKSDRLVDALIYIVLALFALSTLFPLYFVFVMSVTPYTEVLRNGGFVLWPSSFTFQAYKEIFASSRIPDALQITVFITVVGTFLNLLVTSLLAYPLSKKSTPWRNGILLAIVFTLLFNGGLIPTYLVVRELGLYNTIWALFVPGMVSTFNFLIMKTYFESLPQEVEEAARVDGCGDIATLVRIVLPLSAPIMATVGLFYGIGHWNEYFKGIMYVTERNLAPIQVVLRNMIQTPSISQELAVNSTNLAMLPPETIKMATVAVAILPIVLVYPFLQKYFIKGVMIGAVKG
ncbi:putative aldouronate transport system permease protein [Paenibacillus endophyticus]|uniref:Putative aldouronate transport system permease protein n=1 Tax=Paenibacillus endophyticus TaxID=1294268 RepID=A0A7W5GDL5_9BACL|nr:carbohydrate ABC transporter permease [Paenibacillus endophyticus]MBB3155573.1 putative aldouronate transport system permease protein [Paenibacillus endophyticus]